jgi:hypothetical protein
MINLVKDYNVTSTRSSHYPKEEKFADYIFVSKDIEVKDFKVLPDEVNDLRKKLEEALDWSARQGRSGVGLACPQIGKIREAKNNLSSYYRELSILSGILSDEWI